MLDVLNMSVVNNLTVKGVITVLGYILLFTLFTAPLYHWVLLDGAHGDWEVKSLIKSYVKALIWHTLIAPGLALFILGMANFGNYTANLLESAELSYLIYPLHVIIVCSMAALVVWVYVILSARKKKERNRHGKSK